jgi:hypothetical protein
MFIVVWIVLLRQGSGSSVHKTWDKRVYRLYSEYGFVSSEQGTIPFACFRQLQLSNPNSSVSHPHHTGRQKQVSGIWYTPWPWNGRNILSA